MGAVQAGAKMRAGWIRGSPVASSIRSRGRARSDCLAPTRVLDGCVPFFSLHSWLGGSFLLLFPGIALASVEVRARTSCLEAEALDARLEQVLVDNAQSREIDLLVVVEDGGTTPIVVSLKAVSATGDIEIDREFTLVPADCARSTDLLATVLDRFVRDMPLEKWTLPLPRISAPPPKQEQRPVWLTELSGRLGTYAALAPVGGVLDLLLRWEMGKGDWALALEADTFWSLPHDLGHGKLWVGTLAGGLGARVRFAPWLARLSARAGGMLAAGSGFAENESHWLPWLEGEIAVGRALGPVRLLLAAVVSPYRHRAHTAERDASTAISNLRLGLALELPLLAR